jgi:hypothetical protein
MRLRIRIFIGLAGIIGLVALSMIGLPALWHQSELSGPGGPPEALASGDALEEAARELLDAAKQCDQEAEHHEKQAQRYDQKMDAITTLMDTKGFRRDAMKLAADSHRAMAGELRFHAKTHRIEAELLMEKLNRTAKEER